MATRQQQDELTKAKKRMENEAKSFREKGKQMQVSAAAYIERAEKLERMLGEL